MKRQHLLLWSALATDTRVCRKRCRFFLDQRTWKVYRIQHASIRLSTITHFVLTLNSAFAFVHSDRQADCLGPMSVTQSLPAAKWNDRQSLFRYLKTQSHVPNAETPVPITLAQSNIERMAHCVAHYSENFPMSPQFAYRTASEYQSRWHLSQPLMEPIRCVHAMQCRYLSLRKYVCAYLRQTQPVYLLYAASYTLEELFLW